MMEQINRFLDQICKNQSLVDYLSIECDFDLQDEDRLKDDLEFLLEGSKPNYDLEPFACDGAGGVYVCSIMDALVTLILKVRQESLVILHNPSSAFCYTVAISLILPSLEF